MAVNSVDRLKPCWSLQITSVMAGLIASIARLSNSLDMISIMLISLQFLIPTRSPVSSKGIIKIDFYALRNIRCTEDSDLLKIIHRGQDNMKLQDFNRNQIF